MTEPVASRHRSAPTPRSVASSLTVTHTRDYRGDDITQRRAEHETACSVRALSRTVSIGRSLAMLLFVGIVVRAMWFILPAYNIKVPLP